MSEFGNDFLTLPELFPARRAGEPWGDGRVALELAGGSYLLSGLSPDQARALRRRFDGWCLAGGQDATEIRVFQAPDGEFRDPGTRFREYRLDVDCGHDRLRMAGFHVMAVLDLAPEISAAMWTPKPDGTFVEACENFLRLVAAYRILESERVLVHSACLVRGGEAVLFPGRSGAGKSTLSRLGLASGWGVLSDELNVLSCRGTELFVEQVPFTGDLESSSTLPSSGRGFPLAGLCLLQKSERDTLSPTTAGRMLGALLSTAPYVNRDPHRSERLGAVLEEAARRGPAFTFAFTRSSRLEVLAELFATVDAV